MGIDRARLNVQWGTVTWWPSACLRRRAIDVLVENEGRCWRYKSYLCCDKMLVSIATFPPALRILSKRRPATPPAELITLFPDIEPNAHWPTNPPFFSPFSKARKFCGYERFPCHVCDASPCCHFPTRKLNHSTTMHQQPQDGLSKASSVINTFFDLNLDWGDRDALQKPKYCIFFLF